VYDCTAAQALLDWRLLYTFEAMLADESGAAEAGRY
jgi:hypothetical protein